MKPPKAVQPRPCKTCPFEGGKTIELGNSLAKYIENLASMNGQHLCHTARNKKVCRGGRNIQIKIAYAQGFIDKPTNEAFETELKKARNNQFT